MIGRRRYQEVIERLAQIEAKLDHLDRQLIDGRTTAGETRGQLLSEAHAARDQGAELSDQVGQLRQILQLVYDREPEMRERLANLRRQPDYEQAFVAKDPLVSVVIPTYDRGPLLLSRAIPSVIAQSYRNWEIVVVGDHAPAETAKLIAELDHPRVRYHNLAVRGPYPEEARDLWHVAGIPARNAAVALARGSWIAPLDDDDAFHPEHIGRLLDVAQRDRNEVVYGSLRCVMNDGTTFELGTFPPRLGHFGWQSAIFHAGLRFFEMELADALFFSPGDWSLCRRMLRAGVRFEMVQEVVADHYESRIDPRYEDHVP